MDISIHEQLRKLPAVHRVMTDQRIKVMQDKLDWTDEFLAFEIGEHLNRLRASILSSSQKEIPEKFTEEDVIQSILNELAVDELPHLRRVINGTGILLHTNLGRALLSHSAIERMTEVGQYYSNLEYNIETGKRGSRHDHLEKLLRRLTGAEAGMVVNNNAGAVFLILRELAQEKEVILSRGELVEIGGSFRVSEIMKESGAQLIEVGTTNKTRLSDYQAAISSETGLLMKVHTSNFRLVGFTEGVERSTLVSLGVEYGIPVYEDLGSGVLFDLRPYGIGDEPTIQEVVKAGVDVVSFSGDKLLGGPQAGIIVGKKAFIDRLKKNQLARILRVDKGTLASLEETLRLYLNPDKAKEEIPIIRDLLTPLSDVRSRGQQFINELQARNLLSDWILDLVEDETEVGGGTLPAVKIPTWVVSFSHRTISVHHLERALRLSRPAVIGRISQDKYYLDFRTVQVEEYELLLDTFAQLNL